MQAKVQLLLAVKVAATARNQTVRNTVNALRFCIVLSLLIKSILI